SRRDDVGVVAAAHRGERLGGLDARVVERVAVEADPRDPSSLEVRAEPAKRIGIAIDDGDGVALLLEDVREGRADPAASHDHDVHGRNTVHGTTSRDRVDAHPTIGARGPAYGRPQEARARSGDTDRERRRDAALEKARAADLLE